MRNFCLPDTRWKNRGHELYALGDRLARPAYYLVGGESEIVQFRQELAGEILIRGEVRSRRPCGGPVPAEDSAAPPARPGIGLICVSRAREDYEANAGFYRGLGYTENENFFQADLFRAVFFFHKYGQIRLDRVEVFLTSHCTLNCEKCIAFIPYFAKPWHAPLAALKQDLDLLFSKVDFIYKLKLLGGETLLYPRLAEYLEYLARYRRRAGTVCLGTNATLLPSPRIMEICRQNDLTMDVSDYAAPGCRLEEVLALLKRHGVRYDVKRTGEQWLDMGFPANPARFPSGPEAAAHFHRCAMFCREFYDGKLWFCCGNFAAVQAGLFPAHENDYLDFRREIPKSEILEFEAGYSPLGHTTFCRVCRGCSPEANPLEVPVARQKER